MEGILEKEAREEALKNINLILNGIKPILAPNISLPRLANDIREVLLFEGYKDYHINKGLCDKAIYRMLYNQELGVKFNDEYKVAYEKMLNTVDKINKENLLEEKDTTSKYYQYHSDPKVKRYVAFEVLARALSNGVTIDEIKNESLYGYTSNCINDDRIREESISKKEQRRSEREKMSYHAPDSETVKRAIIVGAIIFGIMAVSKADYEIKQQKKREENNKPSYSSSIKNMRSEHDLVNIGANQYYNYESNEIVLGGGK